MEHPEKQRTQVVLNTETKDVEIQIKIAGRIVVYYLDNEVFEFAIAMQDTLDQKREKYGDSWKEMDLYQCRYRLNEEIVELGDPVVFMESGEAIRQKRLAETRIEIQDESTDVANFAMFLFHLSKESV